MEDNKKNEKYVDETTEIHAMKKSEKNFEQEEDDDLHDLEATREFRKIEQNGIARFKPSVKKGLSYHQVEQRRKDGLVNKPKHHYDKSILQIILKNVFSYLNLLLLFVFVILLVSDIISNFENFKITNYFFMVIITSNLLIGIIQEIRAKKIVDKLSLVAKSQSLVIREGVKTEVDAEDLLLDDIVILKAGQKIVSDSIVREGMVEVNESLLTGESLPVKKNPGDMLFAGSFVSSGSCISQVERVGSENYITCLQERAKKEKKNNSVILKSLNWIIGIDAVLTIPFGAFNFLFKYFGWGGLGTSTTLGNLSLSMQNTASSMVAMIPSGLYLTTSIALVVSVIALAMKRTLVQDNYAIEMLARTNVLCLDKTGTITDGTMEVYDEIEMHKHEIDPNDIIGDLLDSFEDKNQTATALLNAHPSKGKYKAIKKLPFSSSRKKSAVEFEGVGTYVIGAPEFMLESDSKDIQKLQKYTEQGYRVLLLGKTDGIGEDNVEGKIVPLYAYIIKDHIRPEAHDTLKWFADNGVDIKIISGDNVLTVAEIAKQAGVENSDKYISLEGLTLEQVADAATKYTIFGRVAPEQKATLVTALKKAGKTVAMTGDGVNDILALKKADCSIAMASGSEAARNVSSLVLIDSNFACLPKVVSEGRRVINNITAVASLFLMKTIFAVILTLSTKYPFLPSNLMILEFFVIGVPSFLLALQPNNNPIKGGFIKNVLSSSVPGGLAFAIGVLTLVIMSENNAFGLTTEGIRTIGGLYISIVGLVALLFNCLPFNKLRFGTFAFCVAGTLIGCFVRVFEPLTGYSLETMSSTHWIILAIGVIIGSGIYIGLMFLIKYLFNRKHD